MERWLAPFLAALSHPARRRMWPAYVAGLIGPGDRKSAQPMADGIGYDRLYHFVAAGVWNAEPLEAALLTQADRLVDGEDAFLVVDNTALPKKGRHSVGVAPHYASTFGKNANCQTLVSPTAPHSASATWARSTRRVRRRGSWASTARWGSGNSASPTCLPARRSSSSLPQ